MQKNRLQSIKRSTRKVNQNKENDLIYLTQNQNEVLRMKNAEINSKIKQLKEELIGHNHTLVLQERDIENLRTTIKEQQYSEDIELDIHQKSKHDQLIILRNNQDMLVNKIKEVRKNIIIEESRVAGFQQDRTHLEADILKIKSANEGIKLVLKGLEAENESLRKENSNLVSKRKTHSPFEEKLSLEIEERIRLIRNRQSIIHIKKKHELSKIIYHSLTALHSQKHREAFILIQRFGFNKCLLKKRIYLLSLIRKKYVNSIKNNILQKLKSCLKPLEEQEKVKNILINLQQSRAKNKIWRIWRALAMKAEQELITKFEMQNILEKLRVSIDRTKVYSAFSSIKFYKSDVLKSKACRIIRSIHQFLRHKNQQLFVSVLKEAQRAYQIDLEVEASAKEQSKLLIMSLYFRGWCQLYRTHQVSNRNIKYRYFNQLKKLLVLKKKKQLGSMLCLTNKKTNDVDTLSKIFAAFKKQSLTEKVIDLQEQEQIIAEKLSLLKADALQFYEEKKQLYQQFSLLKISKYLKSKVQKSFDIWRQANAQKLVIVSMVNLLEIKKKTSINHAFSRLQKYRFFLLKKSISEKIKSCQFSYNYLLEENRHIKQILDKKTHELEKTKFVKILKKIIREEKQQKRKYFYKFLKSGYKYWQIKKKFERSNAILTSKLYTVFFFMLKFNSSEMAQQNHIQNYCLVKEQRISLESYSKAFLGFKIEMKMNKKLKRTMGGIFERNLELDFYVAFGKIKNQQTLFNKSEIVQEISSTEEEIKQKTEQTFQIEERIGILTDRLKKKEEGFTNRKLLSLYIFFFKNVKKHVGTYLQRWQHKIQRENKLKQFSILLERKTRIFLKSKFILAVQRSQGESEINELGQKLQKYQSEFNRASQDYEKFITVMEQESIDLKLKNEEHLGEGKLFEDQTDHMTEIKLSSFLKTKRKRMSKLVFEEWLKDRHYTFYTLDRTCAVLQHIGFRQFFKDFKTNVQELILNHKLKRNLSTAYSKKYRQNAGVGFKIWRLVNLSTRVAELAIFLRGEIKGFEELDQKYKNAIERHNNQVDFRNNDVKLRRIMNAFRQYTEIKITVEKKKAVIKAFLMKKCSVQLVTLLQKRVQKTRKFATRLQNYYINQNQRKKEIFFYYLSKIVCSKSIISKLFINKFLSSLTFNLKESFFTRAKNYYRAEQVKLISKKTSDIQTLIQTFEKKRRQILNSNFRRWRRNQFQIRMGKNLLKKLTRNSMNWRVKDLFYAWKLQKQAKNVKLYHEEEGEVKKRKVEIKRLQIFLDDFKKDKGLLLENDEGNLVVSPRFQEKKDSQIKKDNNLRYKFISRIVLAMNNYGPAIKAWNNLNLYMQVRQKYKKYSLFVRNRLRRPELTYAFSIWHKAKEHFRKMFETMERKDLIKMLNRQKDKMEMDYSKKLSMEEKIKDQMKKHKVLSHQEEKKQKLCAQIFMRSAKKVKLYAFLEWQHRVAEWKQYNLEKLDFQENERMTALEEEVQDLQEYERELRESNEKLDQAVTQALEIAEMVKRISEQRDLLSRSLTEKQFTCESLQEENEELNAKLYLAQKEAMNLLILSGESI